MKITVFFKNGTTIKGKVSKSEYNGVESIIAVAETAFKEGKNGYIEFDNTIFRVADISAIRIKN